MGGQFVVTFAPDLLYHRIAPLDCHICKILLHIGRFGNLLLAHPDIIFRRFRVPFARHLEYLIRVAHRLCGRSHHTEYAAQRGGILLHFLSLLLCEVSLCSRHHRRKVAMEIVACEAFYFRELLAMIDSVHDFICLFVSIAVLSSVRWRCDKFPSGAERTFPATHPFQCCPE